MSRQVSEVARVREVQVAPVGDVAATVEALPVLIAANKVLLPAMRPVLPTGSEAALDQLIPESTEVPQIRPEPPDDSAARIELDLATPYQLVVSGIPTVVQLAPSSSEYIALSLATITNRAPSTQISLILEPTFVTADNVRAVQIAPSAELAAVVPSA